MSKIIKTGILLLSVILIGYLLYVNQRSENKPVSTVLVKKSEIKTEVTAVGKILPKHQIIVKSEIDGIVEKIYHNSGDYVYKGDLLIRIKPDPKPDVYAKAIANVKQDEARVNADQSKLERFKKLLSKHIITKDFDEYVQMKHQLKQDQASYEYNAQTLELLDKGRARINGRLLENTIKSPIEGYILERQVDVGDAISSLSSSQSATNLFAVANMSDLMFKGSVDEMDANRLKKGMEANIEIAALSSLTLKGNIASLSLKADEKTAVSTSPFEIGFAVEIDDLHAPKNMVIRSGYSATATIVTQDKKSVLSLPEKVIQYKGQNPFVKLSDSKKLTPIETGISDGVNIEIVKGLDLNDKVLDETNHDG